LANTGSVLRPPDRHPGVVDRVLPAAQADVAGHDLIDLGGQVVGDGARGRGVGFGAGGRCRDVGELGRITRRLRPGGDEALDQSAGRCGGVRAQFDLDLPPRQQPFAGRGPDVIVGDFGARLAA